MDAKDYPLPHWAIGHSTGSFMVVGTQLATRDGRRCGNAYVDEIQNEKAVVYTDIGTRIVLLESELHELFYPPNYIMDVNEARLKRNVIL